MADNAPRQNPAVVTVHPHPDLCDHLWESIAGEPGQRCQRCGRVVQLDGRTWEEMPDAS